MQNTTSTDTQGTSLDMVDQASIYSGAIVTGSITGGLISAAAATGTLAVALTGVGALVIGGAIGIGAGKIIHDTLRSFSSEEPNTDTRPESISIDEQLKQQHKPPLQKAKKVVVEVSATAQNNVDEHKKHLNAMNQNNVKVADTVKEAAASEKKVADIVEPLHTAANRANMTMGSLIQTLRDDLVDITGMKTTLSTLTTRLNVKELNLSESIHQISNTQQSLSATINTVNASLVKLPTQLQRIDEMTQIRAKLTLKDAEVDALKTRIYQLIAENANLFTAAQSLTKINKQLLTEVNAMLLEKQKLRNDIDALTNAIGFNHTCMPPAHKTYAPSSASRNRM